MITLSAQQTAKFFAQRTRSMNESMMTYNFGETGDYWYNLFFTVSHDSYIAEATQYETLEDQADQGLLSGKTSGGVEIPVIQFPTHPKPKSHPPNG